MTNIIDLKMNYWIGGPPFNIQGAGDWSFCRGQIIYFNPALRRAESVKLYYMFIYNSSWSNLFISRRVHPKLFISETSSPLSGNWMVAP